MEGLHQNGCPLWISGHSLGAALATLTADRFPKVRSLYTFGSPRVGDREFAENFTVEAHRFVNGNDIISRLPPEGLYHHVGQIHVLGDEDIACPSEPDDSDSEEGFQFDLRQIGRLLSQIGTEISRMVPESFRDHVPILYAARLRRQLQARSR